MIDPLAAAALGLALGVRHAADADHVAAVATIVARHGSLRHAVRVGALWGVGHSLTLLVVGGLLVGFRIAVPPRLGLAFELLVAVMLVVLAARALRSDRGPAVALATAADARRPLLVGTIHGLAGSGAVALLALGAIPDARWAVAYLAVFGAGTVVGMLLVTVLVAVPATFGARRGGRLGAGLRVVAGVVSVGVAGGIVRDVVAAW